jgi:hypothetical protein
LTWSPEEGEDVKYTLVQWVEMSPSELAVFQHGFNECLNRRLESPDATPVSEIHEFVLLRGIVADVGDKLSEDPILVEALEEMEEALGL